MSYKEDLEGWLGKLQNASIDMQEEQRGIIQKLDCDNMHDLMLCVLGLEVNKQIQEAVVEILEKNK
jgi:hypothetical protein